jgi:hypothetical protein
MRTKISNKKLIENLKFLKKRYNKIPTTKICNEYGEYHSDTYVRRFGSWNKTLFHCFGTINLSFKPKTEHSCVNCKKLTKNPKFCSRSCAASYNNKYKKKTISYCLNCKIELKNNRKKYCNHNCRELYRYNDFIQKWKNGLKQGTSGEGTSTYIRKYLFNKYNNKCQNCSWGKTNPTTGKIPLSIHHINGNWIDNNENNLKLLCPNCHSLTPNYGSKNKGNGRSKRQNKRL